MPVRTGKAPTGKCGTEKFAATDRATVLSLTVQPLARADSDELALELLSEMPGDSGADQRLLGALFDRSGGNPLFLRELVLGARDAGTLHEIER